MGNCSSQMKNFNIFSSFCVEKDVGNEICEKFRELATVTVPSYGENSKTRKNHNEENKEEEEEEEEQEQEEEQEEKLLINIFDELPIDVQLYILTFFEIPHLFNVALSCRHGAYLVISKDTDAYLWKIVGCNYNVFPAEILEKKISVETLQSILCEPMDTSEKNDNILNRWLSTIMSISYETFSNSLEQSGNESVENTAVDNDIEKDGSNNNSELQRSFLWRRIVFYYLNCVWDPNSRTPDTDIQMHNRNRTISCKRQSKWDTIRVNMCLKVGHIYTWEYSLDRHDNSTYNSYRIFIGIERSTYSFTLIGFDKIVGYNSYGVSYNIGEHSVHRDYDHSLTKRSKLYNMNYVFKTGDKIAIRLDLKNLSEDGTAIMELFKNGEWFHTIDKIKTIENSENIIYYPAISVIGDQIVTINSGTFLKLTYPADYNFKTHGL
jgi:hypothetical protein